MTSNRLLALSASAVTALMGAVPAAAQAPRVVPLGFPSARAAEGFTNIVAAAELEDGRVLLTDSRERAIAILDLGEGTVRRVGRQGEGPGEYRSVFTILPLTDGSFRIYDATQRRFILMSAAGEVTGSEQMVRPDLRGFSVPRGTDRTGHYYFDQRRVGQNGLVREATLYRYDPVSGGVDSVATIMNYAAGQEGRGIVPMPRGDAWSFLPDGSIARIVADDYHVQWSGGDAGAVSGPPIPHRRVRVGAAEREAWLERLRGAPAAGMSRADGGAGGGAAAPPTRSPIADFPDLVPVFEPGYAPASPAGHVWLRLDVESGPEHTVYDLLGRDGTLVRRVRVPGVSRVVGFGKDAVYLARKDDTDLEWLERHRYQR